MHTSGYFRSLVALGLLLGVTSARANAQGPFLTVCRDGTVWSLNRAGICGGHGGLYTRAQPVSAHKIAEEQKKIWERRQHADMKALEERQKLEREALKAQQKNERQSWELAKKNAEANENVAKKNAEANEKAAKKADKAIAKIARKP